jgi:hypothetical protein
LYSILFLLFKISAQNPHRIENCELNFTVRGIEPFDKANISQQEWWESFYQHIVHAEGRRRYGDLVIPESEGYAIIQQLFRNAAQEYIAHYQCLK